MTHHLNTKTTDYPLLPEICYLMTKAYAGLSAKSPQGSVSTPAENLFFFFFIFLDTDPHLASVVCDPLSLFRFEIRVVCVWELVYVCACEHKFGVATNHGKF
jgi:hypothetical protein